ncbi:MAG: hypothetical protein IPK07_32550 [Deltaproteobacteria bacterium]|nr:hypothetical protein [Deltaproteobacteria bacterium]
MHVVLGGLLIPFVVTMLSLIGWRAGRADGKRAPWWPWALGAVAVGTGLLLAIHHHRPIPSRNWFDLAIKVVPLAVWGIAMVPPHRLCQRRWTFVALSLAIAAVSYVAVGLVEEAIGVPEA